MFISDFISTNDFIKKLNVYYNIVLYDEKYYTIELLINSIKTTTIFIFKKTIIDIMKKYNDYYICIHDGIIIPNWIDISYTLDSFYYKCVLLSNENYMLYRLSQ